tara:strand:+ start:116 stop:319 length:204 start_codon:yes stop_codon:yes gene_type:complete
MKIIKETYDGKYIFILAEGEALCVNSKINYKGEKCRILSCHSFVNEPEKFKVKLIRETNEFNESYNN